MIRRIIIADTQEELDKMYSEDVYRAALVIVGGVVVKNRFGHVGAPWPTLANFLSTFCVPKLLATTEPLYPSD